MADTVIYNENKMDHEDFLANLNNNLTTGSVDSLKNQDFVTDLSNGKIKFLNVVKSAEGVLTNTDHGIRGKGVEFLSWCMSNIPLSLFSEAEIKVIVNFYCDCLKSHHSITPPAIKGFLSLVQMQNIAKEEIINLLVHLFQHVSCINQLQPDRYNIFSVLKYVIEHHLEIVKPMGPDFIYGVISFIDGESDPVCLLLVFNFLPFFIKNFDLGHLSEEMFELLTCYFPVDFNSAAKEDIMITREDLAQGLIQCLSASNSFSQQCLPLIFEKLDSSFKTAKIDSLNLLQEICKNLKAENLEPHLNTLWKALTKEILPGNEKQVCEAGLMALSEVIHVLSEENSKELLFTFLNDILTTVKSLINKVDENMFQYSIRVLIATSARSKAATARILHELRSFCRLDSINTLVEKKIVLSSFLPFLKFASIYKLIYSENSACLNLLNFYLDCASCADYEVRKLAFMGISELLLDLSKETREKLFLIANENIKTKDDIKTSDEFVKIWRQLAQHYPEELYSILPNGSPNTSEFPIARFLWAISLIADLPKFTGFVVPIFLKIIESNENPELSIECLLNACRFAKKNESMDFYHVLHSEHNIIGRLISWWMETDYIKTNSKIQSMVPEIIAVVVRNQPTAVQQVIVDEFIQKFFKESHSMNGSGDSGIILETNPDIKNILILEPVLGSICRDVTIPMLSIRDNLINLALNFPDENGRQTLSRLLASFVNKYEESNDLSIRIHDNIFNVLEGSSENKSNAANLFTWVLKGIILAGGPSTEKWITTWFELLGREDVGEVIAEGFQTVLEEDELYLNLDSHCNVKVLYRQKLFGSFSKLKKMYETCSESVKRNYLLAIIRLLKGVPVHLIQTEVSNIVILLIQCLDTDKPDVLLISLEILSSLINTVNQIFSDYIQSFIPRFLRLAKFEGYMKIRMLALNCLYFLGFYPTISVLPFKNQVIQELQSCLDDKKRLVRKEAVRARCRWFLVGAPGEDILGSRQIDTSSR